MQSNNSSTTPIATCDCACDCVCQIVTGFLILWYQLFVLSGVLRTFTVCSNTVHAYVWQIVIYCLIWLRWVVSSVCGNAYISCVQH